MAETIYATASHTVTTSSDSTSTVAGAPSCYRDIRLARYTFPSLKGYTDAESMKLHVFVTSAPEPTSSVAGNQLKASVSRYSTSSDSSTQVTKTLTSAVSTTTEVVFDFTSKIASITSLNTTTPYVLIDTNSYGDTKFTAYNASKKPYFEIEMSSGGTVHYCTGGVWTPCEAYFCTGGAWKKCEARYGTGGQWKELGE